MVADPRKTLQEFLPEMRILRFMQEHTTRRKKERLRGGAQAPPERGFTKMKRYAIIVYDEKTNGSFRLQKKYKTRAGAARAVKRIQKTYPAWVEIEEAENEN